jgi:multiple sugar transport system ATP-binding protein
MTMGDRVAVMRNGRLQQVDEPQRLYDQPANLFVAGFIGTPPMNLLEAKVSVNGDVSLDFAGSTIPVPDEALRRYPGLRGYDGRTVVLGMRSQYLHPTSVHPELPTVQAHVELVEALGSESIVYFRVDATAVREGQHEEIEEEETAGEGVVATRPNLVAEFPAHAHVQLAETMPVAVDIGKGHFFDPETGDPLR